MEPGEHARLRGELIGLQVLVMKCLSLLAVRVTDPVAFLDRVRDTAVWGLEHAALPDGAVQLEAADRVIRGCVAAAQDAVLDGLPSREG